MVSEEAYARAVGGREPRSQKVIAMPHTRLAAPKPIFRANHLSSNHVQKIRVRTKPNGYVVQVGAGLLRRAGREVRRVLPSSGSRVFVITSPNVRRHWG